ncbi:MAG: large conductance mechanosensitive channel protein MscL [Candidatus Saccharibacteria bacterium]|nr:large conductance mechanosensitive channel protein MscL [Candidatus Saccharibacteria bacterium]
MSKSKGFIAEFKEFISKGDVMDLAVGLVIGSAFTAIVTAIVNDIIMPIVGLLVGGVDFTDLAIRIPNFFGGNTAAVIRYGSFIQAAVNFLIIAFALFVVIKAMNAMNERAKAAAEKAAAKLGKEVKAEKDKAEKTVEDAVKAEKKSDAEMIALLKEIRDELKKSKK